MNYILSPNILKFANKAAKIPGIKYLLKPFYYSYKKYLSHKRTQAFLKNGHRILKEFDRVMNENGFHYSVFAGTLLGAIREKSFLKHDDDIDIMLFYEEYSSRLHKVLSDAGFRLVHRFCIDNGEKGLEETYEKFNIPIDIFFIHSDSVFQTYQCDFQKCEGCFSFKESMEKYGYVIARRNEFPVSKHTHRILIDDIEVNAIDNAEEWLACRYGIDYMLPNPNFRDDGSNPRMNIWKDAHAVFTDF